MLAFPVLVTYLAANVDLAAENAGNDVVRNDVSGGNAIAIPSRVCMVSDLNVDDTNPVSFFFSLIKRLVGSEQQ